jgi:hypothetical protein
MFSLGGGGEDFVRGKKKTLWKNNPVLLFQKIMGLHLAFFLLLFVPLTKSYTMDRNVLLVLSAYLPHTWPNQFVSKSTCPNCANHENHFVMECAGYNPFCYGMCWVQAILLWNVLGTTSDCTHFTLPIQKIWVNPINQSHTHTNTPLAPLTQHNGLDPACSIIGIYLTTISWKLVET